MGWNANSNGNGIGSVRTYPYVTAGLIGNYIQYSESGDLINLLGGVSIPYVSGSGLDQIFDFSVLSDNRFDKGSYVGNAFGLPEYYNFPYVGIYYDSTSETTRHYWKITDFGYAVILSQSLLVDNMFFLKAKATTNTSNVIASWSVLYIYSTALISDNLSKMKIYIGIQPDFYYNNIFDPNIVSDINTSHTYDNGILKITPISLGNDRVSYEAVVDVLNIWFIVCEFRSLGNNIPRVSLGGFGVPGQYYEGVASSEWQKVYFKVTPNNINVVFGIRVATELTDIELKNIIITKEYYRNYYAK